MCDALVCSHFNYCDSVLGQANKTDLDRLQVAQNNAVRAIVGAHPLASAAKIRDQLGWLSLEGKRRVHMATTVWKAVDANVNPNADAPQALSDLVRPASLVHDHATRSATSNKLFVPRVNSSKAQKSFDYHAAKLWNDDDVVPPKARLSTTSTECREIVYQDLLRQERSYLADREKLRAAGKEPPKFVYGMTKTNSIFYYN